MPVSCLSCGAPLSTTDTDCPACGGRPVAPAGRVAAATEPPPRVPGRLATGTVLRSGPVRQEPVLGQSLVWASRIGAALTAAALAVAVLAHASLGPLLVVCGAAAVVLALLGAGLRTTLPADARETGKPWWSWVLPLRERARSRTVDVSDLVLKDVTGTEHVCVVTGKLIPGAPATGTVVEAYGRRDRSGRVVVRQLVDTGTGRVLRPRLPASGRLTRILAVATAVVWTAAATAVFVLAAG